MDPRWALDEEEQKREAAVLAASNIPNVLTEHSGPNPAILEQIEMAWLTQVRRCGLGARARGTRA